MTSPDREASVTALSKRKARERPYFLTSSSAPFSYPFISLLSLLSSTLFDLYPFSLNPLYPLLVSSGDGTIRYRLLSICLPRSIGSFRVVKQCLLMASQCSVCSVSIKYQSQVGLCIKRSYHPIVFSYGIYQWRRQRFFSAGAMGVLGVLPRVL